jgi:hypothetical protein
MSQAALREHLFGLARIDLGATNPRYVEEVQRIFRETDDLERAIDETKPLLGAGVPDWSALFTALFDFELLTDKVRTAVRFLETEPDGSEQDKARWTSYHLDHWTFQMDAMLERLDKLVARVVRHVLRPKDKEWRTKEAELRVPIRQLKEGTAKVRDPLAHGLGGGVDAIHQERLWEPFLAIGQSDYSIAETYVASASSRGKWVLMCGIMTEQAVEGSDVIFAKLLEHMIASD